jgi:hypothetical protein
VAGRATAVDVHVKFTDVDIADLMGAVIVAADAFVRAEHRQTCRMLTVNSCRMCVTAARGGTCTCPREPCSCGAFAERNEWRAEYYRRKRELERRLGRTL